MKCYYHPDLDSANACSVCSRALCASCSHSVKGRIFCQDCLVRGSELAGLARNPQIANYSPGRAALFAIIPGIGAVYNRQYPKAIAHVGVYAALWMIADAGVEIFVLATLAFWIFTIIDAYRSAQDILRQQVANPGLIAGEEDGEVKLPVWGIILVLLGIVFLLNNLDFLNLRTFIRLAWPLLFIGAGAYLILYYFLYQGKNTPRRMAAPPPPRPAGAVTVEAPPPVPEPLGSKGRPGGQAEPDEGWGGPQ
jgi:hypothetical protein